MRQGRPASKRSNAFPQRGPRRRICTSTLSSSRATPGIIKSFNAAVAMPFCWTSVDKPHHAWW